MVLGGKGEPEMISYTGEGIGRVGSTGNVKWCGSVFFRKSSGDKLAFLNNMVGVFESEIDKRKLLRKSMGVEIERKENGTAFNV
jgi:hypothetical protein